MEYTNKALIENYLGRDLTESEEAYLYLAVPAIENYIDMYTSSHFGKVDATTRRYTAVDNYVDIDPCTEISNVRLLDSYGDTQYDYTLNTEYTALPINSPVKNQLMRTNSHWMKGANNIEVTAQFSEYYGGVPEDIKNAATRLAVAALQNVATDANGVGIQSESIEGHSITYAATPDVSTLVSKDPFIAQTLKLRRQILI